MYYFNTSGLGLVALTQTYLISALPQFGFGGDYGGDYGFDKFNVRTEGEDDYDPYGMYGLGRAAGSNGYERAAYMDPYTVLMNSVGNKNNVCLQHELMSNYKFFSDMDTECSICYIDCLDKTTDLKNYHAMGGVGFWIRHHEFDAVDGMPEPEISQCAQISDKCSETAGCMSFCDMIFKYFLKEEYKNGKLIPGKRTDSFQRCINEADAAFASEQIVEAVEGDNHWSSADHEGMNMMGMK